MSKLLSTIHICYILFMARTFGEYIHSVGGWRVAPHAVYKWRGKLWEVPTGPREDDQ